MASAWPASRRTRDCRTSRPVGGTYGNVVKIRAAVDADALLAAFVDADV